MGLRSKINKFLYKAENQYIDAKSRYGLTFGKYKTYKIVTPSKIGQPVCIFKPETQETVKLMRVLGFIEDGEFTITYPEIDLWRFDDSSFIGGNDFVIKGNKVFWNKIGAYNFAKNIPLDRNLINYNHNNVTLRNVKVEKHYDVVFSILGVHATVWSHSLSEYYTKLSILSKVLDIEKGVVKVLVPVYKDKQLKQVMYEALNKYERIEVVPIEDGDSVHADRLYYLPRPTTFTDHETYVAIGDDVQPQILSEIIKRELVEPAVKDAKDDTYPKKLFLIRRATHRVLTNNEEVEDFFRSKGYRLLDPSKVTLEEKIKFFYNAEEIVGPFSSAFSNLIFSKPGTKVLMFSNFQRIFENWLSMHYQHFNIDMWYVTGYDMSKNNSAHTSFYVPLEKIESACKKVGINVFN